MINTNYTSHLHIYYQYSQNRYETETKDCSLIRDLLYNLRPCDMITL
jgi:hypothetical protein